MEHESINSNLFVASDTYSLYELLFVADGCQSRHEPAISIVALSHIVCRCTLYEESRVLEDVLTKVSAT
jgi:hypothetical protein